MLGHSSFHCHFSHLKSIHVFIEHLPCSRQHTRCFLLHHHNQSHHNSILQRSRVSAGSQSQAVRWQILKPKFPYPELLTLSMYSWVASFSCLLKFWSLVKIPSQAQRRSYVPSSLSVLRIVSSPFPKLPSNSPSLPESGTPFIRLMI